jgi:hypothetical protein
MEQARVLGLAARLGADALVVEGMAIGPETVPQSENILKATRAVITNLRPDHAETMGLGRSGVLGTLARVIPQGGLAFTAEEIGAARLRAVCELKGARLITIPCPSYLDQAGTLALAVTAGLDGPEAATVGLDGPKAAAAGLDGPKGAAAGLDGLKAPSAGPDPGALKVLEPETLKAPGLEALKPPGPGTLRAPGFETLKAPGLEALKTPGPGTLRAPGFETLKAPSLEAPKAPGPGRLRAPGPLPMGWERDRLRVLARPGRLIRFYDLFSVNDVVSSRAIWRVLGEAGKPGRLRVAVLATRADRPLRTASLMSWLARERSFDLVVPIGDHALYALFRALARERRAFTGRLLIPWLWEGPESLLERLEDVALAKGLGELVVAGLGNAHGPGGRWRTLVEGPGWRKC